MEFNDCVEFVSKAIVSCVNDKQLNIAISMIDTYIIDKFRTVIDIDEMNLTVSRLNELVNKQKQNLVWEI